jgi:hypothetical protein
LAELREVAMNEVVKKELTDAPVGVALDACPPVLE